MVLCAPVSLIDCCSLVNRVTYLKAKARRDRWKEEKVIRRAEMDWIPRYFQYRQDQWRAFEALKSDCEGHVSYAKSQQHKWSVLREDAVQTFSSIVSPLEKTQ